MLNTICEQTKNIQPTTMLAISITKFIFMLPKVVGQAISSNNLQPASKLLITWNILYIVIYLFILVWSLYSLPNKEDRFGYRGYSFISQVKYCVQLYGSSILLFFINIRVTYFREDIRHVYSRLCDMLTDFKELNIPKRHDESGCIFIMLIALVLSAPTALIIDVIQAKRSVPLFLWICLYLPGFSCMVYVCTYIAMFSGCSNRLMIINKTLEEFTYPELSCTDVYSLRKSKVRPHQLLKTLSNDGQNMLDKLLMLYDETCELSQLLNKTCGPELAIYFGLTSATIISLGYTVALDFIAFSQGESISEANTRASDFWGILNFFALAAITSASAKVKQNCEDTPRLLHRLINIYVDLEPFADIYSLQLSHQNATVTAAGFFTLDKSIFLGLLSSWVTYLIILIQFNG